MNNDWRQELFNLMSQEHGVTLMETEIDEIDDIEWIVKGKKQVLKERNSIR